MTDRKKVVPIGRPKAPVPDQIDGVRIGRVTGNDARGEILVDYPGNPLGDLTPRLTSTAERKLRQSCPAGREVLLCFENNDPRNPIVVDAMHPLSQEKTEQPDLMLEVHPPNEVILDQKRLILDAEKEIVLRCGEASITLTSAGKVLIKGKFLLSCSSGANCIKGGSVRIN